MGNAGPVVPVVLLVSALSLRGGADDRPPDERALQQRVEQLIADLGADTREARARAQVELLRLGPRALEHLPPPELLKDSAVRATVRQIRLALEEEQARESVRPSRISLAGNMPLREWLRQVQSQSGNVLDASALPADLLERRLELEFRETPFWIALQGLAAGAGVTWDAAGGADMLQLQPRMADSEQPPLAADGGGVYRVAVQSAGLRSIAGRPGERLLRLGMRFTAEPRLRPLFFAYRGADLKVTSAGRTFAPFSPDAKQEIPFGEGGKDVEVTWDFVVPGEAEPAAVSLTARSTILTAAGREAIAFSDLATAVGAARRRGGVTVTLRDVSFRAAEARPDAADGAAADRGRSGQERDGTTARIQVAVSYDTGGPAFESHRTWIYHNQARLETADGRRIEYDALTTELQRDGAVAVAYQFAGLTGAADDYRFVYVAPTLLIDVPVEVKLSAIPVSARTADERSPR